MNNNDKDNFQRFFDFAELASKQHLDRRQLTFKVLISYVTLLALGFYQLIKFSIGANNPINFENKWWLFVCVGLVVMQAIYWKCLRTLHISSNNDVRRRDFYLKKAECIAYHLSRNPESAFKPSHSEELFLNMGALGSRGPISEYDLFAQREPDIYRESERQGFPMTKWYKDSHFTILIALPIALTVLLVFTIVIKGKWLAWIGYILY